MNEFDGGINGNERVVIENKKMTTSKSNQRTMSIVRGRKSFRSTVIPQHPTSE
jgi:hypothetical protein